VALACVETLDSRPWSVTRSLLPSTFGAGHILAFRDKFAPYAVRAVRFCAMRRMVFFGLRGTTVAVALAALFPLTAACGGSDSLKKQVGALETQLTSVRADQDRLEERLAALEIASPVPSRAAKAISPDAVEHPRLKVIHLSPDQAGPAAEPADAPSSTSPDPANRRPTIRGTGDRIIKTGDGDSGETTQIEEPSPRSAQLGKASRGN
jgi:hypothetical protein